MPCSEEVTNYGTIAELKVTPGATQAPKRVDYDRRAPPGGVGYYVYQMDSDPNELFLAVVFESKVERR